MKKTYEICIFNEYTRKWDAWKVVQAANAKQAKVIGCKIYGLHWNDVSVRPVERK